MRVCACVRACVRRAVSYNVWRFYELVHGGGPCVSRKDNVLHSKYGVSYLQAIIMIQTQIRICLAKMKVRYILHIYRVSLGFVSYCASLESVCWESAVASMRLVADFVFSCELAYIVRFM